MRLLFSFIVAATVVLAATVAGSSARSEAAPVYPWCAHYMTQNGPHNCGFVTLEQCRATVSGIGGTCEANPFYSPPTVPNDRKKASRQS